MLNSIKTPITIANAGNFNFIISSLSGFNLAERIVIAKKNLLPHRKNFANRLTPMVAPAAAPAEAEKKKCELKNAANVPDAPKKPRLRKKNKKQPKVEKRESFKD